MDKILVALDGSSHADKALTLAADLARGSNAKLVLVHVISDRSFTQAEGQLAAQQNLPRAVDGIPVPSMRASLEEAERLAQSTSEAAFAARQAIADQILREGEARAKAAGVGTVQCLTECGDPAAKILEISRSESPDLLIVGSRGLSNLQGMLLGSVSRKVAHHAECTCVTVK